MKLRKIITVALLLLLAVAALPASISACAAPEQPAGPTPSVQAQPSPPVKTQSPPTTPSPAPENKTFGWKITSDFSSVYLVGSIHVARPSTYPLNDALEDAFTGADNLAVEVDVTKVDEASAAAMVAWYGSYPPGDGLKQNMPNDTYAKLEEQFTQYGVMLAQLDMLRPWVVLATFEQLAWQDLGYISECGIDYYFLDKADMTGKNIVELESTEYQLGLLSSLPDDLVIEAIRADLDDPLIQQEAEALFQTWNDGDADKMDELIYQGLIEHPELEPYYQVMFYRRNTEMAQKIEGYLADPQTYFIVVGAGHLVGEKGLLSILGGWGYELEQLTYMG